MNISPRKLIQEPQMRLCNSHLSNKNVLSSFRNESKLKDGSSILAGRSFQIVGLQTLNDLGCSCTDSDLNPGGRIESPTYILLLNHCTIAF